MSSHHPTEPDSAPNSVASTPRADPTPTPPPPPPPARWQHDDASAAPRVRLMCSFGGRILPRPHDNQLRYVGGDTRIVAVHRPTTFSAFHAKLAKLAGAPDVTIKYQLPDEDLDSLISVTTDEDVENMMEEFDRLAASGGGTADRPTRLRLFLFPPSGDDGGFGSVLDGPTSKRDSWFLDVLNGGAGRLERGRSEASSIVSEVPDYLFGLDNNSDEPKPKSRMAHEMASDPGSPVPSALSPKYSSTSSAVAPPSVPPIPDLPPVRTKSLETPVEPQVQVQQQAGYAGNPVWQYVQQEPVPVYYLPPGAITQGNMPVPMPVQYFNHPQLVAGAGAGAGGQIPAGYRQPVQGVWSNSSHARPVYVGGPAVAGVYDYPPAPAPGAMMGEAYEVAGGGGLIRNPGAGGAIPVYPATGVAPVPGDQPAAVVPEMRIGRPSQGQGQGQ